MSAQDSTLASAVVLAGKAVRFSTLQSQMSIMCSAPPQQVARDPRVKEERTESCTRPRHSATRHEQCQVKTP